MVVCLTGIQYVHCMDSQFSVVLRPSLYGPARHSMMQYMSVEYFSRFFRQWRTGHVQKKQVAGEVSLTPGAVIWSSVVGFPDGLLLQGYTQVCKIPGTRYLSIDMLRKPRRNEPFDLSKLGDPQPTSVFIAPLCHSRLLLVTVYKLPIRLPAKSALTWPVV